MANESTPYSDEAKSVTLFLLKLKNKLFRRDHTIYAILTVYSFFIMLFCTKSSPLYVFNDWYDANGYFTMGKGLMNGRVLYVDLIDGKGPFLYFIYGLAWLFDNTGFFGVYLFQAMFVSISIIYVYRISQLFIENEQIALLIAIISPAPMLIQRFYSLGYNFGGGGPDEFARSLMIVSLYYFTLYYVDTEKYRLRHTFIQGVLFSCVFLMKFNLTVFWLGYLLSIAIGMIYAGRVRYLLRHAAVFVLGALLTIFPYIIYGAATRSLGAFWDSYFLFNRLYTNPNESSIMRAAGAFVDAIRFLGSLWVFLLLLIIGLIFVLRTCKTGFKVGYILSILLLFNAVFYTTYSFATIYIPLTVLIVLAMAALGAFAQRYVNKRVFSRLEKFVAVGLVIASTIGMNNLVTYELFLSNSKTAQQQMAEIILQRTRSDSPTLLEINGLDSGFYTATGIIPDEPFFYIPNISHEDYPYPHEAQKSAVSEGHYEFVIIGTRRWNDAPNDYNIRILYDEIHVLQGTGYQSGFLYHLFQLKPNNSE